MTNTNTFHELITKYNEEQSTENLLSLATACTYSVLNKIYAASGNKNILRIKAQVASGEDADLINAGVVEILEQVQRQTSRNEKIDLERQYETRVLNKKIYIQEDPDDCYKTITTTPIQEVYKAIRREIDNAGSVKTDTNGYSYISLSVHDDVSGLDEIVYKRYGKYADIGGVTQSIHGYRGGRKDNSGAVGVYTASEEIAQDLDTLLEKLNLTARQAEIIRLRLSGYGYKAIATKMGVAIGTIRCQLKLVQDKAVAIGLTLDK